MIGVFRRGQSSALPSNAELCSKSCGVMQVKYLIFGFTAMGSDSRTRPSITVTISAGNKSWLENRTGEEQPYPSKSNLVDLALTHYRKHHDTRMV